MESVNLKAISKALVADGKGILAADETVATLSKRFERLGISSTPESRRDYRELLFAAPGAAEFISGVIMYDETIRQTGSNGKLLTQLLTERGIIPGIKVDLGAKHLAGSQDETVTEGLDGLRERLRDYRTLGARFAKWRAVLRIGDGLPSDSCINANVHALGRYAALTQEQRMVPIVEPEVLMDGTHTIERCYEVTARVLHAVFSALFEQRVSLAEMLLKPNMIVSGDACTSQTSVEKVAEMTLNCLRCHVPSAVPGVAFLSGGQGDLIATAHLNAINRISKFNPWKISFSFGRALQDRALAIWLGKRENSQAAQRVYYHRAKCNAAASLGTYDVGMEEGAAAA